MITDEENKARANSKKTIKGDLMINFDFLKNEPDFAPLAEAIAEM